MVRAGLYDRALKGYVPMAKVLNGAGIVTEPPQAGPEVKAFLQAEETLKRAA
ncbi:hypothetical protein [Microvirga sp. TS319]|uniref:hypothetical protein n=1 Tax=Microvirga sp. TS319 TaxID=3241165 RepID=UPI003519E84B